MRSGPRLAVEQLEEYSLPNLLGPAPPGLDLPSHGARAVVARASVDGDPGPARRTVAGDAVKLGLAGQSGQGAVRSETLGRNHRSRDRWVPSADTLGDSILLDGGSLFNQTFSTSETGRGRVPAGTGPEDGIAPTLPRYLHALANSGAAGLPNAAGKPLPSDGGGLSGGHSRSPSTELLWSLALQSVAPNTVAISTPRAAASEPGSPALQSATVNPVVIPERPVDVFEAGPAPLGLTPEGTRPDIGSGGLATLSYTHAGNGLNPFHYDALPLAITLGDDTVVTVEDASEGGSRTELNLLLSNNGRFASGVPGDDFRVSGRVSIDDNVFDGSLVTAEAREFGTSPTLTPGQAEFEVRLVVTGGALTAQPAGHLRVGEELVLLIRQPDLPVESFPQSFSLSSAEGDSLAMRTREQYTNAEPVFSCCALPTNRAGDPQDTGGGSVYLHDGEFLRQATDLEIPGRGLNWQFARSYRSGVLYDGPLGHNWDFNYNRRLRLVTARNVAEVRASFMEAQVGDVIRLDGSNRADRYVRNADGSFTAPAGFFTRLVENADGTFTERDAAGTVITYGPSAATGLAAMTSWADRNGNTLRFQHNALGQLERVTDVLGRAVDYQYSAVGLLEEVRDFSGRALRFQYNGLGQLVAVTSPAVTNTPTGNDFPQGKTERYAYSSGLGVERLNHNLLTVTAPNEVAVNGLPRVVVGYDTDPKSPHVDRVLSQALGGTNAAGVPAGGTIRYAYQVLGSAAMDDVVTPVFETTVTDRNGNQTTYQFNVQGSVLRSREFANRGVRPGDPAFAETRYAYNRDYKPLQVVFPEGNSVEYVYDSGNPDRFQQGNLLIETRRPDPRRGGDQEVLTITYTYEPVYNQLWAVTEARGNDPSYVPPNGGPHSADRYTTRYTFDYQEGTNYAALAQIVGVTEDEVAQRIYLAGMAIGLGDVNGDGRTDQVAGNLVRAQRPDVRLLPGSNQAAVEGPILRQGRSTGGNGDTTLDDTAQAWATDQWAGAAVEITGGTGAGQTRTVASNTASRLTLFTPWAVIPDATSTYAIMPVPPAQRGTSTGDNGADTLRDTGRVWVPLQWLGRTVEITAGTGAGQVRRIYNNTATLLGVTIPWDTVPDATSQYAILPTATQQPVVELYAYNSFGQKTRDVDAEKNVTLYDYYSERDPDGDGTIDNPGGDASSGGYLRQTTRDAAGDPARNSGTNPAPASILHRYHYDRVGNVIREVDGRGIATDYVVNPLNQVVQTVRAAAHNIFTPVPAEPVPLTDFQYLERTFYDHNNNVVLRQVEDRGNTSGVDGNPPIADLPAFLVFGSGQSTGGNTQSTLRDTTRSWVPGQWNGRTVQITGGRGAGQVRTIRFGGATELTLATPWTTTPDATSTYAVLSGTPAFLIVQGGRSTGGNEGLTLNDASQSWQPGRWAGRWVRITGGTGAGQVRQITGNSPTKLTLYSQGPWATVPDATSTYELMSNDNEGRTGFVDTVFKYDILDQPVEMLQEVGGTTPEFLRTRSRYDSNGNAVLLVQPAGNASARVYDERDLVFQEIAGATAPPPLALLAAGDPTGYDVRGGLPSTQTYHYDGNRNLVETVDADDTDGSPANNSQRPSGQSTGGNTATTLNDTSRTWLPNQWKGRTVRITAGTGAGQVRTTASNTANQLTLTTPWATVPDATSVYAFQGDRTRYVYDGFDRRTSVIDGVGNQTVYQYDPADNRVWETRFGLVGGPSPTADGPDVLPGPVSSGGVIQAPNLVSGNLLAAAESRHDELGRLFQTDHVLFVNTITTVRPPDVRDGAADLGKGNLTPGDNQVIPGVTGVNIIGRVTTRTEYDRNSRQTFTVQDDGDTSRTFYDGAGRVIKAVDPVGNTVETAYDDNGNVIETRETDVAQVLGIPNEVFLTTYFHDSLNRLERRVNNLGHAFDYRYDSRNNLVAVADAQGPVTGVSIARRAFTGGPLTVSTINNFGNVTLYFYDGLNRQTRQEVILTASGRGDGTRIGASLFGVKNDPAVPASAPPALDASQGGGDGRIRTGYVWDPNSLQSALLDDQGNVTLYLYDNLNRRVAEAKGLTATPTYFSKANLLGPREIVTPTVATINSPAVISAVQVDTQLSGAWARLGAVAALFPPLADRIDPPTTIVYGYSPDGNVLIHEDENDSETFTKFDAVNRRVAVRVFRSEGNPATRPADSFAGDPVFAPAPVTDHSHHRRTFRAVQGTTKQDFQYDGLSRLTRATDNNDPSNASDDSVLTNAYDSLGRVIEETQQIGTLPARTVSLAWRAENLRSLLTYPNGRVVAYTYDALDRVKGIGPSGVILIDQVYAIYNYIGVDRVLERYYPANSVRLTYLNDSRTADVGYDGLRRPIQLRHLSQPLTLKLPDVGSPTGGDSLVAGFSYQYDRMGHKTAEVKLHNPANSESYTYDSAYRLIRFERAPGGIQPMHNQWTLDGAGNWQRVDSEVRLHSAFNEIVQRGSLPTLADDNGNQADDGTFVYTWDFQNRLCTVTRKDSGLLIASYAYDAVGRRIQRVVAHSGPLNGRTDFYLDRLREIEEYDSSNTLVQQYVYGRSLDEPVVLDRNLVRDGTATGAGDQRLFYHQNTEYSVFALTTVYGTVLEGYQYDAFGRPTVYRPGANGVVDFGGDDSVVIGGTSAVGNAYLFTGRRYDAETRSHYYRARYLDSETGRFLVRDPIGIWSDGANWGNGYAYVHNNPINKTDPLGTRPGEDFYNDLIHTENCGGPPPGGSGGGGGGGGGSASGSEICRSAPFLQNQDSVCNRYGTYDFYLGVQERCFCKCMGNTPWEQKVRGCLLCMRDQGHDKSYRHRFCYAEADRVYPGQHPTARLIWCWLTCPNKYTISLPGGVLFVTAGGDIDRVGPISQHGSVFVSPTAGTT